MKIWAIALGIVLLIVLLTIGFFIGGVTLVALNGFDGFSGGWGIWAQVTRAILVAIIANILTIVAGFYFNGKDRGGKKFGITAAILLVIGSVAEFLGIFVAVAVVSILFKR